MLTTVSITFPLGMTVESTGHVPVYACGNGQGRYLPPEMATLPPPPPALWGIPRQVPIYRMIPGRLVFEVWWRPHEGLSLSCAAEKSYRASLPRPQIP